MEYLSFLRETQRIIRGQHSELIKMNDIVIVYDQKEPRHLWRVGRVIKLIPSTDGKSRGAEVLLGKTKAVIRRPVNRLYPLVNENDTIERTPFTINSTGRDSKNPSEDALATPVENEIEMNANITPARNDNERPKRKAAVLGELRRKFNT